MDRRNLLLYILVGIGILLGLSYWLNRNNTTNTTVINEVNNAQNPNETTTTVRNVDMLETNSDVPVVIEDNVEYFPKAKGYFVKPTQGGSYPGVVMIHENRGLRPEIKATAVQLAKEGYLVLAVDLYEGKVVETQEEARAISGSFNQETGTRNLRTAAEFLRKQGAQKLASLGWCFGGRQSLELAISGEPLDATVVYYGGGMPTSTEQLEPIKWPVLGIFGDKDQAIPLDTVQKFETSLNELEIENEIYVYPGVGHAFANPSGMNYAPNETKDAWDRTIVFLDTHLK